MRTATEYEREMYHRRKAAGCCVRCGVPVSSGTRCRKHSLAGSARTLRAHRRNREGGRCRCGRESDGTHSTCEACRVSNAAIQRNRYAERLAAGVCVDCEGKRDREGARCSTCCDIRQTEKLVRRELTSNRVDVTPDAVSLGHDGTQSDE